MQRLSIQCSVEVVHTEPGVNGQLSECQHFPWKEEKDLNRVALPVWKTDLPIALKNREKAVHRTIYNKTIIP